MVSYPMSKAELNMLTVQYARTDQVTLGARVVPTSDSIVSRMKS